MTQQKPKAPALIWQERIQQWQATGFAYSLPQALKIPKTFQTVLSKSKTTRAKNPESQSKKGKFESISQRILIKQPFFDAYLFSLKKESGIKFPDGFR